MSNRPAAAGANDEDINAYAFFGHGQELPQEFNDRVVVPPGKTIILFAEHNKPVGYGNVEFHYKNIKVNPNKFKHPFSIHPSYVRVYPPGAKFPKLEYYPWAYVKGGGILSGMHKIPIDNTESTLKIVPGVAPHKFFETFFKGEMNEFLLHYTPLDKPSLLDQYMSLINSVLGKHNPQVLNEMWKKMKNVNIRLDEHLLENLPDGVHYFFSCRMIEGQRAQMLEILGNYINKLSSLNGDIYDSRISKKNIKLYDSLKNDIYASIVETSKQKGILPEKLSESIESIDYILRNKPYYKIITSEPNAPNASTLVTNNREEMTGELLYRDVLNELQRYIERNPGEADQILVLINDFINMASGIIAPINAVRSHSKTQQNTFRGRPRGGTRNKKRKHRSTRRRSQRKK